MLRYESGLPPLPAPPVTLVMPTVPVPPPLYAAPAKVAGRKQSDEKEWSFSIVDPLVRGGVDTDLTKMPVPTKGTEEHGCATVVGRYCPEERRRTIVALVSVSLISLLAWALVLALSVR